MRQIDQKSLDVLYTMLLVSLPTEQIDKDFTQSYWLALQFVPTKKNKPSRIFYRGMPQASHGKTQSFVAYAMEMSLAWNLAETERLTLYYDSVEELGLLAFFQCLFFHFEQESLQNRVFRPLLFPTR